MSTASSFDASIPVLTEILHVADGADVNPALKIETQAPAGAQSAPEPAIVELPTVALSRAVLEVSDEQPMLAQQLSERLLQQLQQRITVALEQRMADVLHHALQGLGQEIRAGLLVSIEQIVAHELAQLKAEIGKE